MGHFSNRRQDKETKPEGKDGMKKEGRCLWEGGGCCPTEGGIGCRVECGHVKAELMV